MSLAKRSVWCGVALALFLLVFLAAPPSAGTEHRPRFDVLDRFDREQSPLQGAMVAARDHKWRKNIKLGPDPRCGRVVRDFSKGKDPKLCVDEGLGRDVCLAEYCCESADGGTCAAVDCANALIGGDESDIRAQCYTPDQLEGLAADEPTCAEAIFAAEGSNPKVVDCLENPDRDGDSEIDARCRKIWEKCDDMPLLRQSKSPGSGELKTHTGKRKGHRLETETVIHYKEPKQRGKAGDAAPKDKWDPVEIRSFGMHRDKKQQPLPAGYNDDRRMGHGSRTRSAGVLVPDCDDQGNCDGTVAQNDDGDCVDRITGERRGGAACAAPTLEDLGQCPFDTDSGTEMVRCCRHLETGDRFYADDCFDENGALRTTLEPAFDEDPAEALNNDGDCLSSDGSILTADCLDAQGRLRAGFEWVIDEEGECGDDSNLDQDCRAVDGRIGRLDGGRCIDATDGSDLVDWVELRDEDCFDRVNDDGDCISVDGSVHTSDCVDAQGNLRAGFEWLIDEDGPEMGVEDDVAACRAQFRKMGLEAEPDELPDDQHGCKLSRALRVHVNREAGKHDGFKNHPKVNGKKFFNVDDQGHWLCGDDGQPCEERGVINPRGQQKFEERKVTVNEVFAVKCKPVRDKQTRTWIPTYYDEAAGVCVPDEGLQAARAMHLGSTRSVAQVGRGEGGKPALGLRALQLSLPNTPPPLPLPPAVDLTADSACEAPECARAMMGFTFAPPVLEWGVRIKEDVCIFGFCFEIFYARIGYEFDLAAGLRLPVEVHFEGVPGSTADWLDGLDNDGDGLVDEVLAEETFELRTSLQPMDFTVGDYREFCEQHALDDPWYIADCERFAFPDFLDSLLPLEDPDEMDGDEFVAHYSIFAGIIVRLFYIPLINWAVDSSVDVPAVCTMFKIKNQLEGASLIDILKLGMGVVEDRNVLENLKNQLANCGTFTTPFGIDPETDDLRSFPFLNASYSIRADCFDAMREGEFVTIGGKKRPLCTGLILGTSGASLGVGLGIETTAGSRLIRADLGAVEDARVEPGAVAEARYRHSADDPAGEQLQLGPVRADNYEVDPAADLARVQLDDFTYYLNALQIKLNANLQFGGILSPIPDIGSFTLYRFVFDTEQLFGLDGIPIPQHPDTEPVEVPLLVENYGLAVDVTPESTDPEVRVDEKTLRITPGELGDYLVHVRNIGSVSGSFDNFDYELSNWPDQGGPLTFTIDPNTDHDCYVGSTWYRGDRFDGAADDCYQADGSLQPGAVVDARVIDEDPPGCKNPSSPCASAADRDDDGDGIADEDPVDIWAARPGDLSSWTVIGLPAHNVTPPEQALTLGVSPFRHPFTRPGVYPLRVTADSREARQLGLNDVDPRGGHRLQATAVRGRTETYTGADAQPHIAFIEVVSFYDPQLALLPGEAAVVPGATQAYVLEGTNGANVDDALNLTTAWPDFNPAGCDLVTLGSLPEGCPYRAVPTTIPQAWLIGRPPVRFPASGEAELLRPLELESAGFAIRVPADWAGMQDSTYRFEFTAASEVDPGVPAASGKVEGAHTVRASLESMTRFIGLEIAELIAEIERANAEGVKTGGLHPIATHPVQMMNQRALERILAGNTRGAVSAHATTIHTAEAFLRALAGGGKNLPEAYFADWQRRAEAIVADLSVAVAHGEQLP